MFKVYWTCSEHPCECAAQRNTYHDFHGQRIPIKLQNGNEIDSAGILSVDEFTIRRCRGRSVGAHGERLRSAAATTRMELCELGSGKPGESCFVVRRVALLQARVLTRGWVGEWCSMSCSTGGTPISEWVLPQSRCADNSNIVLSAPSLEKDAAFTE